MQSNTTRIAYLKRMLKRLEGEDARIQQLVARDHLSSEAEGLLREQLRKTRQDLASELEQLQQGDKTN